MPLARHAVIRQTNLSDHICKYKYQTLYSFSTRLNQIQSPLIGIMASSNIELKRKVSRISRSYSVRIKLWLNCLTEGLIRWHTSRDIIFADRNKIWSACILFRVFYIVWYINIFFQRFVFWSGNPSRWTPLKQGICRKLCMIITLVEIYRFMPVCVTLALFQGRNDVRAVMVWNWVCIFLDQFVSLVKFKMWTRSCVHPCF